MFFHKKIKKSDNGMHEINLTPLIDVSLVLVVMLLLATPLALESSIAIKKAAKSAKAAEKKKVEKRIELYIMSDDTLRINRRVVPRKNLAQVLRPLMESSSSRLIVVDCKGSVSHGAFVDVLDQAKICGATEIAVTGK